MACSSVASTPTGRRRAAGSTSATCCSTADSQPLDEPGALQALLASPASAPPLTLQVLRGDDVA